MTQPPTEKEMQLNLPLETAAYIILFSLRVKVAGLIPVLARHMERDTAVHITLK